MSQLALDLDGPTGISYSGGASSRWLIDAVINGLLPRPRHLGVFFADTGDEHEWTYEDVERTAERCKSAGIPFFQNATHRGEKLSDAILSATRGERTRLDNPPFWTENQGGSRGQLSQRCTQIWKTRVIRRSQSEWLKSLGLKKKITTWIGYGTDEASRALKAVKNNDVKWQSLAFPAMRLGLSRDGVRAQIRGWGLNVPLFSMCVECPFATPARHQQKSKRDLDKAIEIDEAIRHGLEHVAVDEPAFISDRLIPLERLVRERDPQPDAGTESHCETGNCFL